MWLPTADVSADSITAFGYYPVMGTPLHFSELYASPRASSLTVTASLRPEGGLTPSSLGGVGKLPTITFSQPARPAQSHAVLVQTPHLHTSISNLAVIVQPYDKHGNSHVSDVTLNIVASLHGAPDLHLTSYAMRGPSGARKTRRYSIIVPSTWFDVADTSGSTAIVSSSLSGHDSHLASLTVFGTPPSFSSRLSAAGIAAYFTSDVAGSIPAATMRAGDSFYLQLYAHTGGLGLTSFEVKLVEDAAVCQLLPVSGAFTASYTGAVQGDLSGDYQTELLTRLQSPDGAQYFTKYSRFQRLGELTSTHGYIGRVHLKMVSGGACLTSAVITTFFHGGSTATIPGVSINDPVSLHGNQLQLYEDAPIGILGQLSDNAPVINTANFNGQSVHSVDVYSLAFSSPDSVLVSTNTISVSAEQTSGPALAIVSGDAYEHQFNFTVIQPAAPELRVDDALLQALPGTCGTFQHTRVRAISDGVDITRILALVNEDPAVLAIDISVPGLPIVKGVGPGSARVYVRDLTYASVNIAVSLSPVVLVTLRAGVVTGVGWASSSSPSMNGPFLTVASHELTSETSEGWIYVLATFDDGTQLFP